jgi:hypothetical protein
MEDVHDEAYYTREEGQRKDVTIVFINKAFPPFYTHDDFPHDSRSSTSLPICQNPVHLNQNASTRWTDAS